MEPVLITLALFGYNQERFIREAIKGAFSQTYSPLEIILSDDFSSDGTFEIMKEEAGKYSGAHEIRLNRNSKNLGWGGHINRLMELAKGELIVAAAGDDISLPRRVEKIYQTWKDSGGKAKSIHSGWIVINEHGDIQGFGKNASFSKDQFLLKRLVKSAWKIEICGACHAWSREVFDIFGPMLTPINFEDKVIPFRSAILGKVYYIEEQLVKHRRHPNNTWQYKGEDISKPDECLNWRRFLAFETVAIYKNWLTDLSKMSRLFPERCKEIEHLKNAVSDRLAASERVTSLYESGYARRLMILARTVFEGTTIKELRQKIGMFLLPFVYRRYLKLKSYWQNRDNFSI